MEEEEEEKEEEKDDAEEKTKEASDKEPQAASTAINNTTTATVPIEENKPSRTSGTAGTRAKNRKLSEQREIAAKQKELEEKL